MWNILKVMGVQPLFIAFWGLSPKKFPYAHHPRKFFKNHLHAMDENDMIANELHLLWMKIEQWWMIFSLNINEKWMKFIHDDVDNVGVYDTMYQTCG